MKRPIKFRGRDAYGKLHYGDLWQRTDGMILFDHDETVWQRVHPESVAQLVGYDCDGREVYEGDFLVNDNGDGFLAELICAVLTDEGFFHADIPPEILKLKEAQS